jgi:hypothetical protein
VVVSEGGPCHLLTVVTVAQDWAFVGAGDGVLDGVTEAGTLCWGLVGHFGCFVQEIVNPRED